MSVFLRTVLIQNRTEAADRTFQEDLPVNPLSHILVTLRADLVAADTSSPLLDLLNMVPSLGVQFRGQDIIRGSLADLAVLNAVVTGWVPYGQKIQDALDEGLSITVPISFSRRPFWTNEAFPAVRRGDLRLEMTVDVAVGNFDGLALQVETVELLDETPERHLKYTTNTRTFATTGEESVRLPIGNPLLGVLLFGSTVPTGTSRTATWEQIRVKVDNVESFYARANWDTLSGEIYRRIGGADTRLNEHIHRYNGAAAAFANTLQPQRDTGILDNYAYLDFDPLLDGSYALETAGRADVVIQRDVGTADVGRYIPVELVSVGGGA